MVAGSDRKISSNEVARELEKLARNTVKKLAPAVSTHTGSGRGGVSSVGRYRQYLWSNLPTGEWAIIFEIDADGNQVPTTELYALE